MKPWSKTGHFYQVIFVFCLVTAMACPALAAKRTALIIGNSNYAASPLPNPVNDATDIAVLLRSFGFKVTLKTDVDLRTMEKSIREFGRQLRDGGVGLFYFAGHGLQVKGQNYLVPIGAVLESEGDVRYEAVNAGLVLGKMEDAQNKLNIVILDACRNNPFARNFRSSNPGLARMDAPTGSLIAYATAPGQLAADGDARNGVYTKHLLKHMKTPGLTIEQVLKKVRTSVIYETSQKQVPWEASSLTGDFYFAGHSTTPAVNPQPPANSYEIVFWESIKDSNNPNAFKAYLEQYPDGAFAPLARIKLQQSAPEKETADPRPVSQKNVTTQLASIDPEEKDPDIVATDGHYIKYKNGIVYDTQTGLEWVASPKVNLLSGAAKRWVSKLTIDGGGWRMPSEDELKSLYQNGKGTRNMTRLIEAKAWHFFSRGSESWHWKGFDFRSFRPFGFRYNDHNSSSSGPGVAFGALAVRPRK
jgi:hypothetical protein